jgi:hypothetical protein
MSEMKNDKLRLKDLRFNGVQIKLCYYDSHMYNSKTFYNQSIISTVLLLPSTEHFIEDYHSLIENLLKKNYRVLVMEFPGIALVILLEFFNTDLN